MKVTTAALGIIGIGAGLGSAVIWHYTDGWTLAGIASFVLIIFGVIWIAALNYPQE